jgi:hypothetical protein
MKRLASFALTLAIALPAVAQRGSSRSGFASRSAPSFHGGAPAFHSSFAPSSGYRYYSAPFRGSYAPARLATPALRSAPFSAARPRFYTNRNRDRRRFYPNQGAGFYSYPVVLDPGYWPYDDDDYDDLNQPDLNQPDLNQPNGEQPYNDLTANPPQAAPPGYAYPAPPPYPPEPEAPYPPQPEYAPSPQPPAPPAVPQMQYVPGSADTVTLIFKDGRPPEQIKNYLATSKTLTVINGNRHHEIPIADLDVPATIKANRETGVGFQLPGR